MTGSPKENQEERMYQATFIFRPGVIDTEFHDRNAEISARAAAIDGFLGEESWRSANGALRSAVYFWATREGLDQFVRDPAHRDAKARQARWYDGYHVIISEVTHTYGDGKLPHITGDARRQRAAERGGGPATDTASDAQ
jgi:heme-degrading monooxygenase HmoA